MRKNLISKEDLTPGTVLLEAAPGRTTVRVPAAGGGVLLPQAVACAERYLVFTIRIAEDHSLPMNLFVYSKENPDGPPCFLVRFGLLPDLRTRVCLDLHWMDASELFPGHVPGQLKVVCHGRRTEPAEIDHISLASNPAFHDVTLEIEDPVLTDEPPTGPMPLPDRKLIDALGQYKPKEWAQKVPDVAELRRRMQSAVRPPDAGYGVPDRSPYGGWTKKKLAEGTGFFAKAKADGRWWLVDPLGYAFFSHGPDCVVARADCRVDGTEKFMDWLPSADDPEYGGMYQTSHWPPTGPNRRETKLFSFEQANLRRAFGDDWQARWPDLIVGQLKEHGINTLGNWSDPALCGMGRLPYVAMLERFPETERTIFRDFPDVLDPAYREDAKACAETLRATRDDPFRIGYFLRNEPAWAFVDHLVIADEVLYNPERTACKEALVASLAERYGTVAALNEAWASAFSSFDDLYAPIAKASTRSERARADQRVFSRRLLEAYVGIPSDACRAVDDRHMNLGMRWAWISDPEVVTGWEHFDVFSINCYAVDPTSAIENVRTLGVDRPVMIGEFHFGALDAGLTATGLEGVASQEDRGLAYRYYCERAAAHPFGVGCHYFQCYDQFALGRFDGENYDIGMFDVCSQPNRVMMDHVRACSEVVYEVADGRRPPWDKAPRTIPMIAY